MRVFIPGAPNETESSFSGPSLPSTHFDEAWNEIESSYCASQSEFVGDADGQLWVGLTESVFDGAEIPTPLRHNSNFEDTAEFLVIPTPFSPVRDSVCGQSPPGPSILTRASADTSQAPTPPSTIARSLQLRTTSRDDMQAGPKSPMPAAITYHCPISDKANKAKVNRPNLKGPALHHECEAIFNDYAMLL